MLVTNEIQSVNLVKMYFLIVLNSLFIQANEYGREFVASMKCHDTLNLIFWYFE